MAREAARRRGAGPHPGHAGDALPDRRPVRPLRRRQLEGAAHARRPGRELPRHAAPCPHRPHRRRSRRGHILGAGPEPGGRAQRRPHSPGPPRPSSPHGLAGRLPQRRRRRGRPGRRRTGAAGRHRRRRNHRDGGRVDDQGDDRPGHRRRRAPRRDPHENTRLHLPPATQGFAGRCGHDERARHPHRRLHRVRGRDSAQRRLESTTWAGLLHRRQRTDDQGNQRADVWMAAAATGTPPLAQPSPGRPSRRPPT